ncbi:MAG: amidohydrolase family protein [Erysipelotrichaceae bacterium]
MLFYCKRIYFEDGCKAGYFTIEDGKITSFFETHDGEVDYCYENARIIPGITDTHNHGGFGYRLGFEIYDDVKEEHVRQYLKGVTSTGVTSMLPTTTSLKCMSILADLSTQEYVGAKIIGIHSEGPWGSRVGEKGVNTGYPAVDLEVAKQMVESSKGLLKLVGIAPEVENAHKAIEYFVSENVNVAIYHSNANYQQANESIDKGVSVATHLCNVMTGLHHRDVGIVGASLLRDEVTCEIICDGLHVSLPMIELILKMKDHDKIVMISDNVQYAGVPSGRYVGFNAEEISDRKYIDVSDDGFVLSISGRLSGSGKPVLFGIYNLVEKLHMPIEEVLKFSSENPIKKYGDFSKKGSLKVGKDADFVVIDDEYQVIATFIEGKKVYDHKDEKDFINWDFVKQFKQSN